MDRERGSLGLMLAHVAVAVAFRVPDFRYARPQHGELRGRARLPPVRQLVRQRVAELRGAGDARRIEGERVTRTHVLAEASCRAPALTDQSRRARGPAEDSVERIGV